MLCKSDGSVPSFRGQPSCYQYPDHSRYIVERIVTVSIETMGIVRTLPPLNERPQPEDWPFAWKA